MADNETKAAPAPQPVRKAFNGYKLGNDKQTIDVQTKYGRVRVTNTFLKNDKNVAMIQREAPALFQQGVIVLA